MQGLQLTQLNLSREKYMDDATKRIEELEAEINTLQEKRSKQSSDDNPISARPNDKSNIDFLVVVEIATYSSLKFPFKRVVV